MEEKKEQFGRIAQTWKEQHPSVRAEPFKSELISVAVLLSKIIDIDSQLGTIRHMMQEGIKATWGEETATEVCQEISNNTGWANEMHERLCWLEHQVTEITRLAELNRRLIGDSLC